MFLVCFRKKKSVSYNDLKTLLSLDDSRLSLLLESLKEIAEIKEDQVVISQLQQLKDKNFYKSYYHNLNAEHKNTKQDGEIPLDNINIV